MGPRGGSNCKMEFDYALQNKGVNSLIPVVMEHSCHSTRSWIGLVAAKLSQKMYVDLSMTEPWHKDRIGEIVDQIYTRTRHARTKQTSELAPKKLPSPRQSKTLKTSLWSPAPNDEMAA